MRSPQNTATTPESRTCPWARQRQRRSPPHPSAPRAGRGRDGDRVGSVGGDRQRGGGLGRLAHLRGPDRRRCSPSTRRHPAAVAIAVGLEALNVPLLLLFVTGLHGLVGRRGGAGADWSRLAVAAGATFSAVMAFYAVLWDGVVLSAGELTEPSPVLELAWQMHAAAFAWSLPALGTTFIGAALATHASGLTPPWQRLLGVAGGGLLLAAGAANLAIADGSAILFVGVSGLAAWLVWLLATGVRLVRS